MRENVHEDETTRPASAQVDADDKLPFAVRVPLIAIFALVPWLLIGCLWTLLR
jgi:hypothetical protein